MRSSEFPTEQVPSGADQMVSSADEPGTGSGSEGTPVLVTPYHDIPLSPAAAPASPAEPATPPARADAPEQAPDQEVPESSDPAEPDGAEVASQEEPVAAASDAEEADPGSDGAASTHTAAATAALSIAALAARPVTETTAVNLTDAAPPAKTADAQSAAVEEPPALPPAATFAATPETPVGSESSEPPVVPVAVRKKRRRWPLWAAAAALLVGAVGAGGYAYADHYAALALPGTTVAGIDVSGMTRQQVVDAIEAAADDVTVNISGDVTRTATLAELGTTVDAEATADAVLARSEPVLDRFRALFSEQDVAVVTETDDTVIRDFAIDLVPDDRPKTVDASIELNEDGTAFEVTPAQDGTAVDSTALEQAATHAASTLSTEDVTVSFVSAAPVVSDEEAQEVADQANGWIEQEVTITSADGEDSYTAEDSDKAGWIKVETTTGQPPTVSLDATKVAAWVDEQVQEANVEPVTGQRNVSSSGTVLATAVEAVAGESVNNADAVVQAIIDSVSKDQAYTGAFEMTVSEEKWEERLIADGAENLYYPAAPGEKWVDVNLTNKTVTAYEGATVVHGPVSMVDGAPETPTVTGTFKVYLKYQSQTMRGQNADGTDYVTEDVPWVTYFYQGYALHGAPWRSTFGYSGSHGCVNLPVGEANWFYTWATLGTTVASHY